jgi:hypothetical protein
MLFQKQPGDFPEELFQVRYSSRMKIVVAFYQSII